MELLRFIKWQWNRFKYDEIVFILDILITASTFAYIWHTAHFLLAFMISVAVFFGIVLIAVIGSQINRQWRLYKDQQAKEAQRIVDRLRGGSR